MTKKNDIETKKLSDEPKKNYLNYTKKITKNGEKFLKNKEKFKKNQKKLEIFQQIKKDFFEWLYGIQEDEPLQIEAKNIYFVVEFLQNDIVLSYSADENILPKFDYGAYFPLEAEYFYSNALKQLSQNLFIKKSISKSEVFDMLKNVCFDVSNKLDFFEDRKVFFGERFKDISV